MEIRLGGWKFAFRVSVRFEQAYGDGRTDGSKGWNMSYEVTEARYRIATHRDHIPPGRVVTVIDNPGIATVIIRPGQATEGLIAALNESHRAMLAVGQWMRLTPGDAPDPSQPTARRARWVLTPAALLPRYFLCLPIEGHGWHTWLIREGEASEQLVAEMCELLTHLVQAGVWVQMWDEPAARPAVGV